MNSQGLPSTQIEIVDISVVIATGVKGIVAVSGVTLMGPVGKPELDECLVGSWSEFVAVFGGLVSYSLFPLICRRALEGGCTLRVNRVAHYTDITDNTSCTGVAALIAASSGLVNETRATGTITITTVDAAGGDTIDATLTVNSNTSILGTRITAASSTPTAEATALKDAINAATGTNGGYTAISAGGVVTVKAPVGSGAAANSYILGRILVTVGSSTTAVDAATGLSGGVTGVALKSCNIVANTIGEWGNDVKTTITAAANGNAGEVDVLVQLAGYPQLDQLISGVTQAISSADLAALNNQLNYVSIDTVVSGLPTGVFTLATGSYDNGSIVDVDYTGNQIAGTGIYALDSCNDFVKVAIPEMADNAIDLALSAYAVMRGDCISLHRTPIGISGNTAVAYRRATTPYSGTAIDTWMSFMFFDGLRGVNPDTLLPVNVTGLGDVMGAMASRDNTNPEWFSFSGSKRGRITNNVLGVLYNVGTAARKTEGDNLVNNGVIPIIDHESFGTVIWGNKTLQKANTLLQKTEVAELCIFLKRALKPLIQTELFDPNDIDTWKTIYRRIYAVMEYVKANRGVWKYLYQGDQDIMDISKAVINKSANIDRGQYLANLWIAPKVGMIYQGLQIGVTNSDVNFTQLTGQP